MPDGVEVFGYNGGSAIAPGGGYCPHKGKTPPIATKSNTLAANNFPRSDIMLCLQIDKMRGRSIATLPNQGQSDFSFFVSDLMIMG